jgi:hypothetical protein
MALGLVACSDKSSSSLPTEKISPQFSVEVDDSQEALLRADFSAYFANVHLGGGDRVVVSSGDLSTMLDRQGNGTLQSGSASGTRFTFDFQRAKYADAPASSGTLPAPMSLQAPASGTRFSVQNDMIAVQWSGLDFVNAIQIELELHCSVFSGARPDDLSFVVPVSADIGFSSIRLSDYEDQLSPACSEYATELSLVRSRDGTVDSTFAPDEESCNQTNSAEDCFSQNAFTLKQVRRVAIVLTSAPD